jgi:hypothetical protein
MIRPGRWRNVTQHAANGGPAQRFFVYLVRLVPFADERTHRIEGRLWRVEFEIDFGCK